MVSEDKHERREFLMKTLETLCQTSDEDIIYDKMSDDEYESKEADDDRPYQRRMKNLATGNEKCRHIRT